MNAQKCWGIGLGRTGTTTLCEAFRILGYRHVGHNPTFEVLRTLDAGADNGVVLYYKYLDYKFPSSKFILTVRSVDSWLESMEYITIKHPVNSRDEDIPIQRRTLIYETVIFDRQKFIDAHRRHHEDVHRYFRDRPSDLLEMDIIDGDGWSKICPFLGLPIPQSPFPHLNGRVPAVDRSESGKAKSIEGAKQ